jgi:hypothetical protein
LGRSEATSKKTGIGKSLIFKSPNLGRSEATSKKIGIGKTSIFKLSNLESSKKNIDFI